MTGHGIAAAVVLLLVGCGPESSQCRHSTEWVSTLEACRSDQGCMLTGDDYHALEYHRDQIKYHCQAQEQ